MKTVLIENRTDRAIRFNSVLKFYPNQPVKITEDIMDKVPAIRTLISRGEFKIVGESNSVKHKDDAIEDA